MLSVVGPLDRRHAEVEMTTTASAAAAVAVGAERAHTAQRLCVCVGRLGDRGACVCVFKAPRCLGPTYTPVLGALVSLPIPTRSRDTDGTVRNRTILRYTHRHGARAMARSPGPRESWTAWAVRAPGAVCARAIWRAPPKPGGGPTLNALL